MTNSSTIHNGFRLAVPALMALMALVAGCDTSKDCALPDVTAHPDVDGDGWGDPSQPTLVCAVPEGFVENSGDCDDARADVFLGAPEQCDGVDNDCDLVTDNDIQFGDYWPDEDSDGYGDLAGSPINSCDPPEGWVQQNGDCDDADADVHVDAIEVCDDKDNNCNDLIDAEDPLADPEEVGTYYADLDDDGHGDASKFVKACVQPVGSSTVGDDCDDKDADRAPGLLEVCDGVDNDCDTLADDDDPGINPGLLTTWYEDADADGLGNPLVSLDQCARPAGHVDDDTDCDDADPDFGAPPDWFADADLDGYGFGPVVEMAVCEPSDPALVVGTFGLDCDDSSDLVSPDAEEICEDGVDNDCDGIDAACPLPTDCLAHLELDPAAASGVYEIEPSLGDIREVWCDMETDGGGWTLVGSSRTRPLSDASVPYHADLARLDPQNPRPGVWNGLRPVTAGDPSDLRFACKLSATDQDFTVDLSVYDTTWYDEFTTGTDAQSCFSENDGAGYVTPAPTRLDNLTGAFRVAGDDWDAGFLEGEDTCNDTDFTIDFDDRGKDGDESDGTDWGVDDNVVKCGVAGQGEAWFLYVRPRRK